MNTITLIGKLGKDPEVTTIANGKKVCKFSVASNEGKDSVLWLNCEAWDYMAEFVEKWFRKGSDIFISGRLKQDKYQDKVYTTLVVERATFAGKSEQQPSQPAGQTQSPQPQPTQQSNAGSDDLPF